MSDCVYLVLTSTSFCNFAKSLSLASGPILILAPSVKKSLSLYVGKSLACHKYTTFIQISKYYKFRNVRENFIFANSFKRHICDITNLRLGHDLPTSVPDLPTSVKD